MSYGIMAYAVHLKGVKAMIGSGGQRLLDDLLASRARDLEDLDELRGNVGLDGDDVTSARGALTHMIMGEEYDARVGFLYGYCLKILIETHRSSEFLPNSGWSAMRFSWFETVGSEMKAAGVDFDPTDLIFTGVPVALPRIDDFPTIGHIAPAAMPALLTSFDGMNAEAVTEYGALDSIREVQDWLRTCHSSGRDLVCFYH
ncbi:DUF7691 family protein [Actinomadura rugatobispora]|uniref:DUF7691 domain-containing protein n=1 Tax=Actinomadura rugatobispora TaxID=1994 RepID=A0ABW0ZNT3_9ACTN|nr:hypothetical protein GCM10010200_043250 [Actinomadura rugatobispora]